MRQADQELDRLRQALIEAWAQIAELRVLADHDSLTGLPNRRRLMAEIEVALERSRLQKRRAALILMDMNKLKCLNDRCGHQAGDAAIVHVARIIRDMLPAGLAARLGGDEFALVVPDMSLEEARDCAAGIAARIAASPLWYQSDSHPLSVSVGVTTIEPDVPAKTLFARADAMMYADKRST